MTISDIPVQVELSEDAVNNGLQVFSGSDYKASLTVTGNRAVVGSLQASDITVKAAANYVDSAGNYTLYLNASKNDPYSNFQISSAIKPSTIDVFIDYLREATFDIQFGNIKRKIKTHNKQVIYHVVRLTDNVTNGIFVNMR